MECAVCGNGDELLYTCSRCDEQLCATHQGRGYHQCIPSPDGDWTPPGTRDTTTGGWTKLSERDDGAGAVERPRAQRYPDDERQSDSADAEADCADSGSGSDATRTRPEAELPPDAARPGYGPDNLRPDPVEPADTLTEWLRRQTYVSLSLKVGFVATLWSAFVFSSLAVGLSVVPL